MFGARSSPVAHAPARASARHSFAARALLPVPASAVQGIWKAHGLAPHRWRFKLSNDPVFAEKLHAMSDSMSAPAPWFDEKSQIQALDTQPGLPMKKGRGATMTHDYKRHGTTTLFAALNVTGEVSDASSAGRSSSASSTSTETRHSQIILASSWLNAVEGAHPRHCGLRNENIE